jgi:dipeptidyl aminopeptidase/acylaminoacyl peptidase
VGPGTESVADVVLARPPERSLGAIRAADVGEPARVACEQPLAAEAMRRAVTFGHGSHMQRALVYLPVDLAAAAPTSGWEAPRRLGDGRRPLLLTVYPGSADEWECASVPLAAAGYAVLAVGPDYSFDLERDIDDLDRLLAYVRTGSLAGADGNRVAVLGGSYSSLHVQRLLQRDRHAGHVAAVLLLGPITDLFDMRRRLEDRTFVPPFGLDQALLALGLPDREPLRYWRYSAAYHVRPDLPPIALIHSRADDVVPVEQSELLARELQGAGVPFELHVLTGGGHNLLSESDEARAVYDLTLDFLARHLRPG